MPASNLPFDFLVDRENNRITVKRGFAADLPLVWDAWTKPELLDQWWAPKPFRTQTKSMDFRPGGAWLYAMIGPENEAHWCKAEYQTVEAQRQYSALDGFCDEHGNLNESFPRSLWTNAFNGDGDTTTVDITIAYDSLADLEKIIQLGFKEGFSMAMENLDQYIAAQFQLRQQSPLRRRPRVSSYVNFPGNTEEVFNFYKAVFRTEFADGIKRFGEIPAGPGQPSVAESVKNMVLHVELPLLGGHVLMGTDAPQEMGFVLNRGNNMHIQLEPETREDASRLFNELSAGGVVEMPMQDMFFGAYFGSFTDRFGINWMIHFQNND